MTIELKVPEVGESVVEVEIGEWRKAEGDHVRKGETVVEIETDKVTVELPAPASGRLAKIVKKQGEEAEVGDIIGTLEEADERPGAASKEEPPKRQTRAPAPAKEEERPKKRPAPEREETRKTTRVMPAAQRLLDEHGLSADKVEATGPGGRLLKEDVQRHVEQRAEVPAEAPSAAADGRAEEIVRMTPLRRRVSARLVEAQRTAALLTTFNEVEMSAVMALRRQHQEAFSEKYGVKLGFMSFFVKACVDALKQYPRLNAEIRGDDIVYRNYQDISVAVSTDKGLVVPVLRNAHRMSFAEIELALGDFTRRARENQLTLEELEGGTFTITNGGVFGSLLSTPIINPPQSGVLGMHRIEERPVAREGQVVIRPMMYVALTYDHRIVDGREAVLFLRRVRECVETPPRMLIEI